MSTGDIASALRELAEVVASEHERAAARERIIDRLHEDNQMLRRGEWDVVLEPVRNSLFALYTDLRREAEQWSTGAGTALAASHLFDAFAEDVSEALERLGLVPFTPESGETFDPVRHRRRRDCAVDDPALDGTVFACLTNGFTKGDRVVRRADIELARCSDTEPAQTTSEDAPR
ncbi:nucleotide exchange factor GrpE [Nocardia sp. NPDC056952]|uniref:nucleotide exchange factor GrpE n=1 Tax=Nocardia sp. NPDC056952 TaxID=3345979 RepID=UPI00362E2800